MLKKGNEILGGNALVDSSLKIAKGVAVIDKEEPEIKTGASMSDLIKELSEEVDMVNHAIDSFVNRFSQGRVIRLGDAVFAHREFRDVKTGVLIDRISLRPESNNNEIKEYRGVYESFNGKDSKDLKDLMTLFYEAGGDKSRILVKDLKKYTEWLGKQN